MFITEILTLLFLLGFSAFFSGSEVALFSLDKKKIKDIKKENELIGNYINYLLNNPRRLLFTILVGNTVANVLISVMSVTIMIQLLYMLTYPKELIIFFQISITVLLVILFGELTPKVWASRNPVFFARIIAIPMYWINVFMYPISKTLTEFFTALSSGIKFSKKLNPISSEDLEELAEMDIDEINIEGEKHGLIQGLFSFRNITAREVMTPRVDIVAVAVDIQFDELIKTIHDSGKSRIPLYNNSIDEIIGIIYAKDILPYLKDKSKVKTLNLKSLARKPLFVPETKLINSLMQEFQEKKTHLGIVVDEYGGTAGLISLEDIIEEIVGDIKDEYDKEETYINQLSENSYIMAGKVTLLDI